MGIREDGDDDSTGEIYAFQNDDKKPKLTVFYRIPYITVNSPYSGVNWYAGTTHTITWNDNLSENVKLELYNGNGFVQTISSSTASDGSYNWTIPQALSSGSYRIKITSTTNSSIYGVQVQPIAAYTVLN